MTRAAAVGAWALAGLGVTLAGSDPLAQAIVLGAAWSLLARRRAAGRRLRPLALGVALLAVVTVVMNGVLVHTGATVLAVVPSGVPLVGGAITAEAFAAGGAIALALVAAVTVAATLALVLDPADLVDALPSALQRTGAALGSALNLVPATAASFVAVRDAQRLRGWRPKGARAVADLAVPVVLGAIDRSVQLAESMEARAFGSGARTRSAGRDRSARCAVVVVGAALAVAGVVAARLTGGAGAWYPYPTPSWPAVGLLALGPSLLVAALSFLVPHGAD